MIEFAFAVAGAAIVAAVIWFGFRNRGVVDTAGEAAPRAFRHTDSLPSMTNVKNRACDKREELRASLQENPYAFVDQPLLVGQIMTEDVALARPSTPLDEIAAIMGERRVRHVPIVDAGGRLLGVVSDRDVAVRRGETAKDIMSPKPVSISHRATVADAVEIMLSRNISSLPVYNDDAICGILTSADVMLGLQCACDALRNAFPQMASLAEPGTAAI